MIIKPDKKRNLLTKLIYSFCFVIFLLIFAIWYMPVGVINGFLDKKQFAFGQLTGSLHQGAFKQLIVNSKTYDFDCSYQRQLGLNYKINCTNPVQISAYITIQGTQSVAINNTSLQGDLANSSALLQLMTFPKFISNQATGTYSFTLNNTIINSGKLTQMDLSGKMNNVSLKFYQPTINNANNSITNKDSNSIFDEIKVTTQQPKTPIKLITVATGNISMNLTTTINPNKYETIGIIKGEQLDNYRQFLRFFGKRVAANEWQIQLTGAM